VKKNNIFEMKHDVYHYKLPKLGIIASTSLKYKELHVNKTERVSGQLTRKKQKKMRKIIVYLSFTLLMLVIINCKKNAELIEKTNTPC
jgi:hypothetical protein